MMAVGDLLQQAGLYLGPFLVVLSIVVFIHEFGHYFVARLCGVKVDVFSIGFGKEIFGWNDKHGTRWKVSWLPLGGYVKMFGDSDPSSALADEKVKNMSEAEKKVAFYYKNPWQRFAIVFAGPAFNYLFALVIIFGLFAANGRPYSAPIVGTVLEDSPALVAGLQKEDEILSVGGRKVESFEEIVQAVSINMGTPLEIKLLRAGEEQTVLVTPNVVKQKDRFGNEFTVGRIGISSKDVNYRKLSVVEAAIQSAEQLWIQSVDTLKALGQIIEGRRSAGELGGPLRIAEMSGNFAKEGILALIWFMSAISINLGLINLFPVPLLDGGHLVIYLAEIVRGKPLSERMQEYGARVGLGLVLALMLFVTWNDLVHIGVVKFITNLFS